MVLERRIELAGLWLCMCVLRLPSFLKTAVHRSHLNFVAGLAATEAKEGVVIGTVVVAGEGDGGEIG